MDKEFIPQPQPKPTRAQIRASKRESDKINAELNALVMSFAGYCKLHFNQERVDKFKELQTKWIAICNKPWKYNKCVPHAFAILCEQLFTPVAGITTKGEIVHKPEGGKIIQLNQ